MLVLSPRGLPAPLSVEEGERRRKMRGICPYCEEQRDLERVRRVETLDVRGEPVEVSVNLYKCKTCDGEFEDPKSQADPLETAYTEYRKRHHMVQPDEMKAFRKRYALTQSELSKLLGWGPVTLSRYENGALQDEVHDKVLRLAMDPGNLKTLIEEAPDAVTEEKKARLLEELRREREQTLSLERFCEEHFSGHEPDEYSGHKKLDLSKLFNVILYFCKGGVFKTKINKLLFYADFLHFKEYHVSITGCRYAHATFGPVPDKYETILAALVEKGWLEAEEFVCSKEGVTGEKLIATTKHDLNAFSDSEIKILATIRERFDAFTSKQIMEFSHKEEGYKNTDRGRFISYTYADELRVQALTSKLRTRRS
jgi:putative zinc finger/helix-turn-helix YgiT family protein